MSHELIYTSVPKGLKPGSRGFSTVAMTSGLSSSWVDRLESLSGYQPIYPLGDANADRNPVSFCHWRVTVAGKARSVLSRVAFAGADYSQRSNKFAHHILLDPTEQAPGGPAWMMHQRNMMRSNWTGEPQIIPAGPALPTGDRPIAICSAWAAAAGDAGWAGVLAESYINTPSKPAYLIFEPGTDVLLLFEEALSLLSPKQRWEISFNTYFTELPLNLTCAWRAVPAGTQAEKDAMKATGRPLIFDLTRSTLGDPGNATLVTAARIGRMNAPTVGPAPATKALTEALESPSRLTRNEQSVSGKNLAARPAKRRRLGNNDLILEEPSDFDVALAGLPTEDVFDAKPLSRQRQFNYFPLVAVAATLIFSIALVACALWYRSQVRLVSFPQAGEKPPTTVSTAGSGLPSPPVSTEKSATSTASEPASFTRQAATSLTPLPATQIVNSATAIKVPTTAFALATSTTKTAPDMRAPTAKPPMTIDGTPKLSIVAALRPQAAQQAATQPAHAIDWEQSSDTWTVRLPLTSEFKGAKFITIVWPQGATSTQCFRDTAYGHGQVVLSVKANAPPALGIALNARYAENLNPPSDHPIATIQVQGDDSIMIKWCDPAPKITSEVQSLVKQVAIVASDENGAFIGKVGMPSASTERLVLDAPLTAFEHVGAVDSADIYNFTKQQDNWNILSASDTGHAPWTFVRNGDVKMFSIEALPSDTPGAPKFICKDWSVDLAAANRRLEAINIIISHLEGGQVQGLDDADAGDVARRLQHLRDAKVEEASANQKVTAAKKEQKENEQTMAAAEAKAKVAAAEADANDAKARAADAQAAFDGALRKLKTWRDELTQFTTARSVDLKFHLYRRNGTELCTVSVVSANMNTGKDH